MLRIGILSWLVQTLVLLCLVLGLLLLAGCGSEAGPPQAGALAGRVDVDGSSTVFPLSQAVAEDFMRQHGAVRIPIEVSGTGGGFYPFVRGETDVSNASRPISAEEARLAWKSGVRFVELPVAYDGLAVLVHPANDWAACLTVEELPHLGAGFDHRNVAPGPPRLPGPAARALRRRQQQRHVRLLHAGHQRYRRRHPARLHGQRERRRARRRHRRRSERAGFLRPQLLRAEPRPAQAGRHRRRPSRERRGCVLPGPETVQRDTYQPLSRLVFIYVNQARLDDPAVSAFVSFYLAHAAPLARELGFVPLPKETCALVRERLVRRLPGSVFSAGGAQVGVRMEALLRLAQRGIDSTAANPPPPSNP